MKVTGDEGSQKPKTKKTRMRYVFMDIVEFTRRDRSNDDMVEIIVALNGMVNKSLAGQKLSKNGVITLATGDGMCLGLRKATSSAHIHLAFEIRTAVENWCATQDKESRKFQLRISLHVYEDYEIRDINNKWNIIGHGINTAARIMSLCSPGEIVASGDLYRSMERDEEFMGTFSPSKRHELKKAFYDFRNIELSPERRNWKNVPSVISEPLTDNGEATSKHKAKALNQFVQPKPLVSESIYQGLIVDDRLRLVAVKDGFWHPSKEPATSRDLQVGHPSFAKEFPLKMAFRSFSALVSPNSEHFRLAMKLMNDTGTLNAHKVYGEVSLIIQNSDNEEKMKIGLIDAGISSERTIPAHYRPRFEVRLNVRPLRTRMMIVELYINKELVHTMSTPKEFTKRFGLMASGNSNPCHMTISEINVSTSDK
jgi:class 3 adenylate cyclase